PVLPEVVQAMDQVRPLALGNPSARHATGTAARQALSSARRRVASALGVSPRSILFVRGGTEADNLAVLGRARARPGRAILHSALEHSAVRQAAQRAAREGAPVEELAVAPTGAVELPDSPGDAAGSRDGDSRPTLVSVQQVNSETGLLLQLGPVREWCAARDVVLHVDAVQAPGRVPLPSSEEAPPGERLLLALSGHKLGGPRSAGVLVAPPEVELVPLHFGGPQERGLRAGTEDLEAAVGMATALERALEIRGPVEAERLRSLVLRLEEGVLDAVPDARSVVPDPVRAPHILSLVIEDVPPDLLLPALDALGVCASAGSACRTGSPGAGPVLRHLLGEEAESVAPLRLSVGHSTTEAHVEEAIPLIAAAVERIRSAGL
ncbi:MAG: aminotransferase class V-fold PLP-dependent enzyme, partial [Gemmatimonadales bacterium]